MTTVKRDDDLGVSLFRGPSLQRKLGWCYGTPRKRVRVLEFDKRGDDSGVLFKGGPPPPKSKVVLLALIQTIHNRVALQQKHTLTSRERCW